MTNDATSFALGASAPDAFLLARSQGELEARLLNRADTADGFARIGGIFVIGIWVEKLRVDSEACCLGAPDLWCWELRHRCNLLLERFAPGWTHSAQARVFTSRGHLSQRDCPKPTSRESQVSATSGFVAPATLNLGSTAYAATLRTRYWTRREMSTTRSASCGAPRSELGSERVR